MAYDEAIDVLNEANMTVAIDEAVIKYIRLKGGMDDLLAKREEDLAVSMRAVEEAESDANVTGRRLR